MKVLAKYFLNIFSKDVSFIPTIIDFAKSILQLATLHMTIEFKN